MKRALIEFGLIFLLMIAAGTAYTLSTAGNSRKHLAWVNPMLGKGIPSLPSRSLVAARTGDPRPERGPEPRPGSDADPTPSGNGETGSDPNPAPAVLSGSPADSDPPSDPNPPPGLLPAEQEGFRFVDHDVVRQHFEEGGLFIDSRRTEEYERGHITGAISISYWEEDAAAKISRFEEETPLEIPIVVYCTLAKDCEDSQMLAAQLHQAGFLNLMVYRGGFPEWKKKEPMHVTVGSAPGTR